MNYARNYLNTANLADRIRESMIEGQKVKPAGGLAARQERQKARKEETADFEVIRANYMNDIRNMFSDFVSEEKPVEGPAQLSFGLEPAPVRSENPEDYALGAEVNLGDDFYNKLIMSESSGNPQAVYTTSDGRSYVGLGQIGEARLQDYNKATGSNVEQADMLQNVRLQKEVLNWHLSDLSNYAKALAEETGMNALGLVAVGHLGGRTGMTKFAKSRGKHSPSDELGTSLMDYYRKFSG